ncbi:MAG: GNAT family N-acetyltransferase [Fluviicola sp.]|nr:MAG: GNAT family N-acetyltransferase [Fluviicola sp.]
MNQSNKNDIINILTDSFQNNKSTNFVVQQDSKRAKRFRSLIEYSIFHGEKFGEVFLSEDKTSCYIILDTEKKKLTWSSLIWDLRLVLKCIGIARVIKVMKREALIKSHHPKKDFIHLWYIGVSPAKQGEGKGTKLMQKIIDKAQSQNKKIFLETSTQRNFKFYESFGFTEVVTLDQLGYSLKMFSL